jgi:predicted nucleotidyltransferase
MGVNTIQTWPRPKEISSLFPLFGSYAYGTPHDGSDVDLLVIMHTADPHGAAVRIQYRLTPPFSVDLVVRTPEQLARRLARGESFLRTVVSQGKVLYEKDDARVGSEGRKGLHPRHARQSERRPRS